HELAPVWKMGTSCLDSKNTRPACRFHIREVERGNGVCDQGREERTFPSILTRAMTLAVRELPHPVSQRLTIGPSRAQLAAVCKMPCNFDVHRMQNSPSIGLWVVIDTMAA